MEQPFIGKHADVCNKKACISLAKGDEDEALAYWQEARDMKGHHFDSHINLMLYKWRTGLATDEEVIEAVSKE